MKAMIDHAPLQSIKTNMELVSGGDLRSKPNAWLRSAWQSSNLKKVPRERQVRLAVQRFAKKTRI